MKRKMVAVVALALMTGCTKFPVGSFVPYTTPDGQHGWRYGARGLTQAQIDAGISEGIALNKICPIGYETTSIQPSGDDITLYEGRCK